jgi:hypothetical protein
VRLLKRAMRLFVYNFASTRELPVISSLTVSTNKRKGSKRYKV